MPTQKDFKRLVRTRMQKTGEAYTTARAYLLNRAAPNSQVRVAGAGTPALDSYARLADISDAAVKAGTGCTWERWVKALDRADAHTWPHSRITRYVREKYRTPSWWTQMVVVGYERIKGLRAIGQPREGGFNATKSQTFPVPLARLYRSFRDQRIRSRWLQEVDLTVRSATPGKYVRMSWPDGTSVEAGFSGKGRGKSQVQIQHGEFADKPGALRAKQYWEERLGALKDNLLSVQK